jgi:hypothetical protein
MMYFFFHITCPYLDLKTAMKPTQQAVRSPNSAPDEEKNKDNVRILPRVQHPLSLVLLFLEK